MRGNKSWLAMSAGALAVACGGSAVQQGEPGAAGATGSAGEGNMNGARTPEVRASELPLSAAIGSLSSSQQQRLCSAMSAWDFRLALPACDAFVQSALQQVAPTSDEDFRAQCQDELFICHLPTAPLAGACSFPATCTAKVSDIDDCFADREQWLATVPACNAVTLATAVTTLPPAPASCAAFDAASCAEAQ